MLLRFTVCSLGWVHMASVDPSKMALAYPGGVNAPTGSNSPRFSASKDFSNDDNPPDSFERADTEQGSDSKQKKGHVPRWVIATMAWMLPVIANVGARRFLPNTWSDTKKVAIGMLAGGATASGLEYWREKNNDGKIKWGNWALNSLYGFIPFDFVLARMGLSKGETISRPPNY
jgi:hypothetical protein